MTRVDSAVDPKQSN